MKNLAYLHTPIGLIELTEENQKLISITFVKFQKITEAPSLVLQEAKWQLEAYFEGKRKSFKLPLRFKCSSLEEKIYLALQETPYGSKLSYKKLAAQIDEKNITRVITTAIEKNPFPIIIPCHRLLKNDGSLGGYRALGSEKSKKWLLAHETEKAITLR